MRWSMARPPDLTSGTTQTWPRGWPQRQSGSAASTTSCARQACCASGRLAETDPAVVAQVIDVNLTGSLNVARAAYPYLRAEPGFADPVHVELVHTREAQLRPVLREQGGRGATSCRVSPTSGGPDGIRVNAMSPERTATPMRRSAFPDESHDGMLGADDVALATLRLIRSDLTGQVVDVKRGDMADDAPGRRPERRPGPVSAVGP